MKNIFSCLALLFIAAIGYSQNGLSLSVDTQLGVIIRNGDHAFKSITPLGIQNVKTLSDLKEGFPDSWIESYESVIIRLTSNGKLFSVQNKAHELSADQKVMLGKASYGDEISVSVTYYSNNTSATKEPKTISFAYVVIPEYPASCDGGYEGMERYLTSKTLKDLSFAEQELIKNIEAKFTIDNTGAATNVSLTKSSNNERLDKMIKHALNSMPKWAPARSADGNNVSQDFMFSIDNMIGC